MASVVGVRTTSQLITETRIIRNVRKEMSELNPEIAPFVTFMGKMKGAIIPVTSPRYEWMEDDYVPHWAVNGSSNIAASALATSIPVVDGTMFKRGTLFIVPQAASSATAPEMIRVVSVAGNTLTVVRNVGGAGLVAIAPGDSLLLLSDAQEEGFVPSESITTAPSPKISYTQIVDGTVSISKTKQLTKAYASGGNERKRLQDKLLREKKMELNRAFLFAVASESLTGGPNGREVRTTMGLNSVISTNVTNAFGTLTRKTFEAFARQAFLNGTTKTKLLLSSPIITSAIHMWGDSMMQLSPSEKVYGVTITRINTGHGTWLLANDVNLTDGVSGKSGMSGWAFSVDVDQIEEIELEPLHLIEDAIKDGRHGVVDQIVGQVGLSIREEASHAKLFNVTDFQS